MDNSQALDKSAMRAMCLDRRNALSPEFREKASRQICRHVMDFFSNHALLKGVEMKGLEISAYLPIRSEVDLSDLIPQLESAGALISLPVVLSKTEIVFRRFRSGDVLQSAGFGTTGPAADAETVDPTLLLMPLAGFDTKGARIGYGAGHYDRAIERLLQKSLTPITIGIGFAAQNVPQVPAEPHDMPLAAIVTENGIMNAMDVNA
ncbi:5-formyltetrahydrofolate cyclo-ligase [Pararhizobium sp. IMCC21322]|uniref:5-formyltetrahydrofolate cyclo-ligase n=1 Tax=Pararhizobium sp. IMCC21322 TaxID=3067903 RepID=UPI002741312C|nr:5-formyltetrahydrofolate cyclo-ligase [Pararhizobium sp. IMCC21322]